MQCRNTHILGEREMLLLQYSNLDLNQKISCFALHGSDELQRVCKTVGLGRPYQRGKGKKHLCWKFPHYIITSISIFRYKIEHFLQNRTLPCDAHEAVEPSEWCLRSDLWKTRTNPPCFSDSHKVAAGCHFFVCRVWQSERKISAFRSTTHRGSVTVNGNPSWGPNTRWERKMGTEIWEPNFHPAVGKAVSGRCSGKRLACASLSLFALPWTVFQPYLWRGFDQNCQPFGQTSLYTIEPRIRDVNGNLNHSRLCEGISVHPTDTVGRSGPPDGGSHNKISRQCDDTSFTLPVRDQRMDGGSSGVGVMQKKISWHLDIQILTLARLCISWRRAHGCYTFVVTLITRHSWAYWSWQNWSVAIGTWLIMADQVSVWDSCKGASECPGLGQLSAAALRSQKVCPKYRRHMYCPKYLLNPKETNSPGFFPKLNQVCENSVSDFS